MTFKKSSIKNTFVIPMMKRYRSQSFHHKLEERGGARNTEREFLEELDEELVVSFQQTKVELEAIEAELGLRLNIKNNIREELIRLDRANQLEEDEVVARWHQLRTIYMDWLRYEEFNCCGGTDEQPPQHCQDCPNK